MLYKKSAVHFILVLLLSFSLLLPPSSTTNTHLTVFGVKIVVKERNEVIHRNLGNPNEWLLDMITCDFVF
ncbi:hypothetical protein Goshw_025241 [Gossypium schwendimanii]|uniref:Transmembrane protein n=1 Tax=Gossypium schwendimanii TaxID=34291 RepID=A0A7J9NBF7_GOSSC|nr:hypothetical protein [Gossypium schwendimanii]